MKSIPDKNLIEEVAVEKGIDAAFVEKDWYVTQIIKIINDYKADGFQVIFTGGTALSKAYGLLQRFSEDIDFRVINPDLTSLSRSRQRAKLSAFKKSIFNLIAEHFDIKESGLTARNDNRFFAIELDYPTAFDRQNALRPHILIEFTVTSLALPAITRSVTSFVNELTQNDAEIGAIKCIDPVENATDKLSALVWRIADRVRGQQDDDPSIVRHLHDLGILSDYAINHAAFRELSILVIQQDDSRCCARPKVGIKLKANHNVC